MISVQVEIRHDIIIGCTTYVIHYADARAFPCAVFGQGSGGILDLDCSSEYHTHVDNCSITSGIAYCDHREDVGIQCNPLCAEGSIRLFKGANLNEGIVEVCKNGSWGSIKYDPDDPWGAAESRVICRQLGLPYTG